jgi:hypothetical protein
MSLTTFPRAHLDLSEADFEATKAAVLSAKLGTQIRFNQYDAPLIVQAASYGHYTERGFESQEAFEAAVIAGEVSHTEVTLTEDGGYYDRSGWHDGDDESDIDGWIAFERWSTRGREAHGFIDPTSRKLVQSG